MKHKNSPQLLLVVSILFTGLLMATLASESPLTAQPAQSQVVAFRDTYSRDDGVPPEDSLGTTEAGPGLVVLGYRELGGCCGTPGVTLDGTFGVRGFVTGMDDSIPFAQGIVDAAAFATADLDGDGRLEMGEPFTLRLILDGDSFSFTFNGLSQLSNLDLSDLPTALADSDRLLFGRNRWRFASTAVEIRFDNLRSLEGLAATSTPTSSPTPTATPTQVSSGPILSIPNDIPASAGQLVSVPVNFTGNGHSIASTAFSVDYDQTCLAFDSTDSDGDGIPDAVTLSLPAAFSAAATFDGNDTEQACNQPRKLLHQRH